MDVTTMVSIHSLINKLRSDFPAFTFAPASEFWWSADKATIYYDPKASFSTAYTLHELSHALLEHVGYIRDIELLKLERDAWEHAKTNLGPRYGVSLSEDTIQDNLDTYRHWLHARSTCPDCETTGIQIQGITYRCLFCASRWQVNEARLCALRRYAVPTK
jgi:hypothetical protein